MLPTMYTVTSDLVESIGFSLVKTRPGYGRLFVRMKNTAVYAYEMVPEIKFHEFMTAMSKGSYFLDHIKDRYETNKVLDPQ